MEFQTAEVIVYSATAAAGSVGGLARQLYDGGRSSWRRSFGRVLAGGVFAFGGVGYWIGSNSGGLNTFPWHAVVVAPVVGFYAAEIHELLEPLAKQIGRSILKRLGIPLKDDDE